MKKRAYALPFIVICLSLLSGCFLYDEAVGDNIGPYIDPANIPAEDFLPGENAQKVLDLTISEEAAEPEEPEDEVIEIVNENHIRLLKPPVTEQNEQGATTYYYDGGSFIFQVPFLWRKTMIVDIITEYEEEDEIVYYIFYYVPEEQRYDPPRQARVMTIRAVSREYFNAHGHGADGISATEGFDSGSLVFSYLKPTEEQQLPADFPDIEGYLNIQKVLSANWDFRSVEDME